MHSIVDTVRGVSHREAAGALAAVVVVNVVEALPAGFVGADTSWIDRP
jgi:hypothetical protein